MTDKGRALANQVLLEFIKTVLGGGGDPDDWGETSVRVEEVEFLVVGAE